MPLRHKTSLHNGNQSQLTHPGSDQFYEYTRTHIGQPMAIVLDGRVLSAPTINAAIHDSGTISGSFTQDEAESLAIQMRYGALPVPLRVVDIHTIGASLGRDSVDSSFTLACWASAPCCSLCS